MSIARAWTAASPLPWKFEMGAFFMPNQQASQLMYRFLSDSGMTTSLIPEAR